MKDYSEPARKRRRKRRKVIKSIVRSLFITILLIGSINSVINKNLYEDAESRYAKLHYKSVIQEERISELTNNIEDLEEDLQQLEVDYEDYNKLKHRKELYDEYEYVLFDSTGKRTDMTYEYLEYGIDLMESEGIDPDLLFSIIMVESEATEKATNSQSTARGFCQMLSSTGKSMYELLGYTKPYNHDMAFDGKLNIEMGVKLISRNMEKYNGDVNKVLCLYTGSTPVNERYLRKLNKYLSLGGTSLSQVQNSYKEV